MRATVKPVNTALACETVEARISSQPSEQSFVTCLSPPFPQGPQRSILPSNICPPKPKQNNATLLSHTTMANSKVSPAPPPVDSDSNISEEESDFVAFEPQLEDLEARERRVTRATKNFGGFNVADIMDDDDDEDTDSPATNSLAIGVPVPETVNQSPKSHTMERGGLKKQTSSNILVRQTSDLLVRNTSKLQPRQTYRRGATALKVLSAKIAKNEASPSDIRTYHNLQSLKNTGLVHVRSIVGLTIFASSSDEGYDPYVVTAMPKELQVSKSRRCNRRRSNTLLLSLFAPSFPYVHTCVLADQTRFSSLCSHRLFPCSHMCVGLALR